jgi:hypothetical protein
MARTAKLATKSDMETKAARSRANAVIINSHNFCFCFFYVLFLFYCQYTISAPPATASPEAAQGSGEF